MKQHFIEMFNYENWAIQRIISVLRESQDDKALWLFSHILFAREVWLDRICGRKSASNVWQTRSLADCVKSFELNQTDWISFLNSAEDFERVIFYKTTEGVDYSNAVKEILTHVVNHSTYHRGQITNTLKDKFDKLPSTDFIFYLREKQD